MSLTASDFWDIFDFALNQVMALFTLADSVVIVDSPRFSIWSLWVSILFLTLVLSVLNWLRGVHMGSGGSNWDYIMQRNKYSEWLPGEQESFELDLFAEQVFGGKK